MNPRPYDSSSRQKSVTAGRQRIIDAALELLEDDDAEGFSIDAVARRAGVARMTVYNQFESKAGLLEALFDVLAQRGLFGSMTDLFQQKDGLAALDSFVAALGRFWTANRRSHRRLRAAALHDAELDAALTKRNERRRQGLTELVQRLGAVEERSIPDDEIINVLFVLLSFETFDAFAGADRTPADVIPLVQQLVHLVVGV